MQRVPEQTSYPPRRPPKGIARSSKVLRYPASTRALLRAHPKTRLALITLLLFLASTALYGGLQVVPALPAAWLQGTLFHDFTIPAVALTAIGALALLSAGLLIIKHAACPLASLTVGVGIAIFEVVETSVLGLDVWLHALGLAPAPTASALLLDAAEVPLLLGIPAPLWLQPFYFIYGVVLVVLAGRLMPPRPLPTMRTRLAATRHR